MKQFIIISLLCFAMIGCTHSAIDGLVPCEGTVTLDGAPLADATIGFVPVDASGAIEIGKRGGVAISTSNGHFTIKAASDSSGIAPGTYKVTVVKMIEEKAEDNKSPIPKSITGKYSNIETCDLMFEISAKGNKNVKLELKLK